MANTIFYNADYIVVEYTDLIKAPYLIFLKCMRRNKKLNEILKLEQIEFLDDLGLHEWYLNRRHQNFLMDLNRYPDQISEKELYELLDMQMNNSNHMYSEAALLALGSALPAMKIKELATRDIIIYHPHKDSHARQDLYDEVGYDFTFMDNFEEVLDIAKENSTYFLSNVDKIMLMKEKGYLKCSSITIPVEYRYNKKNMTEYKYDFDTLYKENPFKLSYISAWVVGDDQILGLMPKKENLK